MSWHYRARRREDKGSVWYDVVEFFEGSNGMGEGWSQNSIAPMGETKADLVKDLRRMLDDVRRRPTVEDMDEDTEEP